jgi:hypothetical protein
MAEPTMSPAEADPRNAAIFALTIADPMAMGEFLRDWADGDVAFWPEYGEHAARAAVEAAR